MFITIVDAMIEVSNIREVKEIEYLDDNSEHGKYKTYVTTKEGKDWRLCQGSKKIHEAIRMARDREYAHQQELKFLMDRIRKAEKLVDEIGENSSSLRMSCDARRKLAKAGDILDSGKTKLEDESGVGYIH